MCVEFCYFVFYFFFDCIVVVFVVCCEIIDDFDNEISDFVEFGFVKVMGCVSRGV